MLKKQKRKRWLLEDLGHSLLPAITIFFMIITDAGFCITSTRSDFLFNNKSSFSLKKIAKKDKKFSKTKKKKPYQHRKIEVTLAEAESKGVYNVMRFFQDEMCIKELPLFLALHRCFYSDERLSKGSELFLQKNTIVQLLAKAAQLENAPELSTSSTTKLDSLILYKKKENRAKSQLCNFIAYIVPGTYDIPKTSAKITVPRIISGSIYYNSKTTSMIVYLHTGGIKLELPSYAKTLSLGMIGDMDIGFAELDYSRDGWTGRVLYKKSQKEKGIKGWSFNVTECKKIRPYSR